MYSIKQRIPNFVSTDEEEKVAEFETVDELLGIDFVRGFSEHEGFEGYITCNSSSTCCLMARYNDGHRWCIGTCDNMDDDIIEQINKLGEK